MALDRIIAGDTYRPAQATVLPAYPATDGWTLKYRLVPLAGGAGAPIIINCVASGADHQPQETAANTASWTPGEYAWTSYVTRGAESFTLEIGRVVILPDPRTVSAGLDGRSQAERALGDLKAALAAHATSQGVVAEYEIAGRRMKFKTTAEIIKLISHYEAEVEREQLAAQGLTPARRRIFTRI